MFSETGTLLKADRSEPVAAFSDGLDPAQISLTDTTEM
jgi:hypothetical protein